MKKMGLLISIFLFSLSAYAQFSEKLSYFDGAVEATIVSLDQSVSIKNKTSFNLKITDANGNPYALAAKWITASLEMTNMNMGVTKAKITDVLDADGKVQGIVKIEPTFSMVGPWKMSIKLQTAEGSDVKFISFDVVK